MDTKKINFKKDNGSVTLFVLIAMIFFLIVCFFIYTSSNNKKISQMRELEQLKKNYESTAEEIESKYESITGDTATNVNLTSLVTGEDVSHTHVYEKKYDDTSHWEECFICGNVQNKQEHHKTTTGTGSCGTYLVEYCTDGCGYSVSTYVYHEVELYDSDVVYDESGGNTNTNTYYHWLGKCKNCGSTTISKTEDKNGQGSTQQCIDEDGKAITCSNRKKCVVCGYDWSKLERISHQVNSIQPNEEDGKTYALNFTISPDTQAPTINNIQINKTEIINGFSKKATIIVDCSDSYSDVVDIALYDTQGNCLVDYGTATNNGNKTFTRTYNFYGDIYDKVTAAIYLKDALGNEQMVKVDIGKLDNTAPTITKSELVGNKVILEANDRHETLGEGSGVTGYRYVTSSRDMNKRIMSGEGTFTEVNEIDISNMDNVKYLYIAPVDKVGNIGQTIKIELPT